MNKFKETLHDLTWPELMQQVRAILSRDEKKLENDVNYYKKLLGSNSADKEKLNNLFERLQLEKLRYTYFSELFFRLDEQNYKFMIMNLESCIRQETEIQNKTPKDWVATVRFENGQLRVYFMALSYYQ